MYIDFIEEKSDLDMNENPVHFSLAKVNNDEIPELIYFEENRLTQIIWLKNGEIQWQGVGNGDFLYMEKGDLFYGFYSKGGYVSDSVYKFDDNEDVSQIFKGTGEITDSCTMKYTVDNDKISQEDYEAKLGEVFDKEAATSPEKYQGKSAIIKAIEDYR